MSFKPWMLAAMEDYGYMDTQVGKCNKVARYLSEHGPEYIGNGEFIDACHACNLDPYSFDQSDLGRIQKKLNDLT